jgi:ectoine hydroxylase-related dioxygenase (phytanoyl-CoA dioxygenase family)
MTDPQPLVDLPIVDGTAQDAISDAQARAFIEQGLLVIRSLIRPEELSALQRETQVVVERAVAERHDDAWIADVEYRTHQITRRRVPMRVEYVIDKSPACRALLGHPFILRSVEKLQGPAFIPTWDSMVFKLGGQGAEIPWHRDAGREHVSTAPIFNVDFYLDGSDLTNCLWAVPGSNQLSDPEAAELVQRLGTPQFNTQGAVSVLMNPGDVLFHNILLVHGSPAATSQLRRVIYYEFRPCATERLLGPHRPDYIPIKERVLLECLRERRQLPYAQSERPFDYAALTRHEQAADALPSLRFPHRDYM